MKKEGDGGRRIARVEREVQQTIARFLISGFKLPLPGIVTVARVQMPGDLRTAKVYISVIGEPSQLDEVVKLLQGRAFEIQNYLGKELKMRYCPKLSFYADFDTQQILKVERILQDLEAERNQSKKVKDDSSEEDS
ncbi:MAG TPA: 30S ribosome-binding factor RbfA [Pseudobdellovibrionaceae bacterium]|jgi:ribosome-binding factor A